MIIDISNWQKPELIDYDQIASQIDGAILRAAYGTGAPGKYEGADPSFARHYEELHKRGVPLGAYHYITEYQPIDEQARLFIETVRGKDMQLGYWCDAELEKDAERLTAKSVIRWMELVEAEFGECGIYTGRWTWKPIMGDEFARFADRPLWMSAYTASPDNYIPHGWTGYDLWQYTSSGRLDGYAGNLDMSKRGNMTLNVPLLSQKDTRWKDIKLGTSASTIGGYGCPLTCAAMVARYYGHDTDPAKLNELLKANNGYQSGNLFVFGAMSTIYPDVVFSKLIDCKDIPAPLDQVDGYLAGGYPVIVMVDYNPSDADIDQHWVIIVGKEGASYLINDPIDGQRVKFESRYGNPERYIFRIAVYKGTPAPVPDELPLYRVRVRDGVTQLVIRSGAGPQFPVVYRYASGEYGVFEESNGYGRIGVNRWVSLSWVEKVVTIPEEVTDPEKLAILWAWYKETHG